MERTVLQLEMVVVIVSVARRCLTTSVTKHLVSVTVNRASMVAAVTNVSTATSATRLRAARNVIANLTELLRVTRCQGSVSACQVSLERNVTCVCHATCSYRTKDVNLVTSASTLCWMTLKVRMHSISYI